MGRYTTQQLQEFRKISECENCVHYNGCPFWISLLLVNEERHGAFFHAMMPDITRRCIMFVKAWWK
jgi:hypothetical protein